jgi:hypothetical protein
MSDTADRLTPKEENRAKAAIALAQEQACDTGRITMSGSAGGLIGGTNSANARMPDVGEIVLVDLGKSENGTRIHPGIVTRAWSPNCINVRVFADAGNDYQYNSVIHKSQIPPASSYAQPRPLYWYRRYEGSPIE